MKKYYSAFAGGVLLLAFSLLFSCKKPIQEPLNQLPASASGVAMQTPAPTTCKPAILGGFYEYGYAQGGIWTTLAQKWYSNGKVKYLKATHGSSLGLFTDPILEFIFQLNWGEITYEGNQVNLTDIADNRMHMRVTLDDEGRPVASYYHYKPNSDPGTFLRDTTYYYYEGDRLLYFISIYEMVPYANAHMYEYRKYECHYDSWGNLVNAEFPGRSRFTVQYDYTKPVSGIMSTLNMTSSVKLLEYMELLKIPMHHAVAETATQIADIYPGTYWTLSGGKYKDYVITDGLVRSYVFDQASTKTTLYNGWECGSSLPKSANGKPAQGISSLNQFQQKGY